MVKKPKYILSAMADIGDIPTSWIYKYFSKLFHRPINQPFDGRMIKIKSFTNRDTEPSLCIYYDKKKEEYLWYDHSCGKGGDAIDFVTDLYGCSYNTSVNTIISEFQKFKLEGGEVDSYEDIEVDDIKYEWEIRKYENSDLDFWAKFKIRSNNLIRYKVFPLKRYKIIKNGSVIQYSRFYCYGFFYGKDQLYQIYLPTVVEASPSKVRYLNIDTSYLIGREQLRFNHNVCIITSGLKDMMAFNETYLSAEVVAPRSENTIIKYEDIEFLKSKYEYIVTMFDNDEPGRRAMKRYETLYNIPSINIYLEKDLADNNAKYGIEFCRKHYALYLNKLINK